MADKYAGSGIVVVGGQWGDEGKGRVVDSLAAHCDIVARFQGGNNAGHSLHIDGHSIVLHLIPCGIVHPGKICVIGNGTVLDAKVLFEEIDLLSRRGIECSPQNLKIAKNAHIIFPIHRLRDFLREQSAGHVGTTLRGIGPCYENKVARFGIMAKDLLCEKTIGERLEILLAPYHDLLSSTKSSMKTVLEEQAAYAKEFGQKLAPFLIDVGEFLHEELKQGKRVLFEGAQGALLDVDHGTYPFVTSSNCVAAQASIGCGIGPLWLKEIFMVSKAYCTRVGEGAFFTEASLFEQEKFRKAGNEFGATTGRPRRCGWLDLPALRYAARINGITGIILTKVDILAQMEVIKVGTSYRCGSLKGLNFLEAFELYSLGKEIEVNYEELKGGVVIPQVVKKFADLPLVIQTLCRMIENTVEAPLRMISFGASRGQEIFLTSCAD